MLARVSVLAALLVRAALRAGLVTLLVLSFLIMATPTMEVTVGSPPLEVFFTSCEGTGGIDDCVLIGL